MPQKADLFIYLRVDDNSFLKPKMRHLIKFLSKKNLGFTILKMKLTKDKSNEDKN